MVLIDFESYSEEIKKFMCIVKTENREWKRSCFSTNHTACYHWVAANNHIRCQNPIKYFKNDNKEDASGQNLEAGDAAVGVGSLNSFILQL